MCKFYAGDGIYYAVKIIILFNHSNPGTHTQSVLLTALVSTVVWPLEHAKQVVALKCGWYVP